MKPPADAVRDAEDCGIYHRQGTVAIREGYLLCFFGLITPESAKKFVSTPVQSGANIVVNSLGGDVEWALTMADYVQARHASIIVTGYCISSCANYLFVAGKAKTVLPGALLGFHGGPPKSLGGVPDLAKAGYRRLLAHQDALYSSTGADERMMYLGPPHAPLDPAAWQHTFWEYGPATLRDKFGVTGIVYFATPHDLSWFSPVSCEAAGADAWLCTS